MSRSTSAAAPPFKESDSDAFKRALRAANIDETTLMVGPEAGYEVSDEEGDEEDEKEDASLLRHGRRPTEQMQVVDPRFEKPKPSALARAALLLFVFFLFWLAFHFRPSPRREPEIVYAKRYSKEFKYRPAASPIITETLKDGRIRLRGAIPPAAHPTPMATPTKASKKKRTTAKKRTKKSGLKKVTDL